MCAPDPVHNCQLLRCDTHSPARSLEAYRFWVARFQAFIRSRPASHLSNQEVRGFLSSLAVQRNVSASSQNQAFNALLFFFRHVFYIGSLAKSTQMSEP